MAVSSATPPVNTIVIASRPIIDAPIRVSPEAPAILGVPGATAERKNTSGSGMTAAAAPSSAKATNSPAAAPSIDNTTPSATNCRTIRPRLAPIATRTATSRRRAIALAAMRFVRFTHAISSTKPTAPSSTSAARRTSGSTREAYMELARAVHPAMPMSLRGNAASTCRPRTSTADAAVCSDTSCWRRATIVYECDCAWVSCEGSKAASGTQTSAVPIRPRKPRGSTPITVYGAALMRIVRPTTAGSPPKRRVHTPWLIMAAGGVPAVCTSSQVNGRPISGATPRTDG